MWSRHRASIRSATCSGSQSITRRALNCVTVFAIVFLLLVACSLSLRLHHITIATCCQPLLKKFVVPHFATLTGARPAPRGGGGVAGHGRRINPPPLPPQLRFPETRAQ